MQSFEKMPAQPAKEDLFFLSASLGFREEIIKLEPNIPVAKNEGPGRPGQQWPDRFEMQMFITGSILVF